MVINGFAKAYSLLWLFVFVIVGTGNAGQAAYPAFRDGERVCFVGNSITADGYFYYFINLYYATRFPDRKITFYNCGIAGNKAAQILARLDRDVLSLHPSCTVLMVGMNDVNRDLYRPGAVVAEKERAKEDALSIYKKDLNALIQQLKNAGNVILLRPSIYDQTSRMMSENLVGVNDALGKCCRIVDSIGKKYGLKVVDLWTFMNTVNARVQQKDAAASIIGNDRVHPGMPGHFVMAYQFITSTNSSPFVSEILYEGNTGKMLTRNCSVEQLNVSNGNIRFFCKERSLPFPVEQGAAPALHWIPFEQELNRETIRMQQLQEGAYDFYIDSVHIGRFTKEELAKGIDLAQYPQAPQYRQAIQVRQLLAQRALLQQSIRKGKYTEYNYMLNSGLSNIKDSATVSVYLNKQAEAFANTPKYGFIRNNFDNYLTYGLAEEQLAVRIAALNEAAQMAAFPVVHQYRFIKTGAVAGGQVYNIMQYGAVNDTAVLSTEGINRAVTACSGAGGGRVVIPAGHFKSGTIFLKDNVELYFEPGAVLYGSTAHEDYPRQPQAAFRSQKDKHGWFALIYAVGASNISITGKGIIDGQGAKQLSQPVQPGFIDEDRDGRPRNILFISCHAITVKDVTMRNSGMWNQHYLDCEDVLVDRIQVYNHSNRNNDAIDIDGCRRVIVSNSLFDSDDDGITLKSTGIAPCEEIAITNCVVSSYSSAIKFGTESTGGFRNISISNCIVRPTRSTMPSIFVRPKFGAAGIVLDNVDGGIMTGVNIDNIVIEGTDCPIFVRLGNRARKHIEEAPTPPVGQMSHIRLSNITAYNTGNQSCSITGVPGGSIGNIELHHISIYNFGGIKPGEYLAGLKDIKEADREYPSPNMWGNLPSYGFFIRHVQQVSLSDIALYALTKDDRVPIIADDVRHLFINNLRAQGPPEKQVLVNRVPYYQRDNQSYFKNSQP